MKNKNLHLLFDELIVQHILQHVEHYEQQLDNKMTMKDCTWNNIN